MVVYVDPVTAAFEAGLQPGDVIQSINGKAVSVFKTDRNRHIHIRSRPQKRKTRRHDSRKKK
jgi:C-terminal processing protease CtpA/Prc